MWSPHDIEVLLHHHYSPTSSKWPLGETPTYVASIRLLNGYGLLDRADSLAAVTDKGRALIDLWCSTPVPVAVYIDPRLGAAA